MHRLAWFFAVTATMLVTNLPEPWIPAYVPVPWPIVNVPRAVSVSRQVLELKLAVPPWPTCLNVNVPPGKMTMSVTAAGMTDPPAVKAPVAITLSRDEVASVFMMRRCSARAAAGLAPASTPGSMVRGGL